MELHHHHHHQKERDELYESFQKSLYDVQQKTGFKNLLLVRDACSTLHFICNLWVLTLLLVLVLCRPFAPPPQEKKLDAAGEALEKKEAQLTEVLASTELEPSMLGSVNQHLQELIDTKDATVRRRHKHLCLSDHPT